MLVAALHENSIVIVPFGENPAFDFLKSKLIAYGSIGSQGSAAPHHVWWGGLKPLPVRTGLYPRDGVLFLSSFAGVDRPQDAARRSADLTRLGLDGIVEHLASDAATKRPAPAKIAFIIEQWEQSHRPVFWIDPAAQLRQHPILPQSLGCDFAVHRRRSGEIDTAALFFHQTEPARALLDIWKRLSDGFPELPDSFLLDQAWTLAASQRQLESAWLPPSYWRTDDPAARDDSAVIVGSRSRADDDPVNFLAAHAQQARRFGRHQAPESHLVMPATAGTRGPITVLVRDVLAGNALEASAAIEAAAQAFATDSGGFSKMEVVLCAWDEDVEAVLNIADDSWVLVTDPSERLEAHAFRMLETPGHAAVDRDPARIFRSADPLLGARLKRSGRPSASFLQRPA
jgi:hypothetical protein